MVIYERANLGGVFSDGVCDGSRGLSEEKA